MTVQNRTGSDPHPINGFVLELRMEGDEFSLDPNFVDLSPNEHAICQAVMEIETIDRNCFGQANTQRQACQYL